MNYEMEEVIDKPEGWPANAIECQLENIQMQLDEFMKNRWFQIMISIKGLCWDFLELQIMKLPV